VFVPFAAFLTPFSLQLSTQQLRALIVTLSYTKQQRNLQFGLGRKWQKGCELSFVVKGISEDAKLNFINLLSLNSLSTCYLPFVVCGTIPRNDKKKFDQISFNGSFNCGKNSRERKLVIIPHESNGLQLAESNATQKCLASH